MKVFFDHAAQEASNIKTFYFRPEQKFNFTAGQYGEWTLPHPHADSRGIKRWFTISSSPKEELLSLTTKFNEKGSSFKEALLKLTAGDVVNLNGPLGDFVLPKLIQTPLVFVAGGIGITPYHSILSWLTSAKEKRPINLIYGVRNEDEIVFQETFDKADQHVTLVVEEPSPAWGGERGHITADLILGLANPNEETSIYVSGPEPMVEALEKALIKAGIKKNQLVLDFFPNYPNI